MTDRIRVKDKDTGHERTISAHMLSHGNYQQLEGPAVDERTGEDLPPVFATRPPEQSEPETQGSQLSSAPSGKPGDKPAENTNIGHKATDKKEG